MGKAEFRVFSAIWRVFGALLGGFVPDFALFPSMSCAYLDVNNFGGRA
jgi:hypothetical protein